MDPAPPQPDNQVHIERTYYPDGSLQEEAHYRNGSAHGPWRKWHPNGVLAEEWFLDKGVYINCTNRTWFPDGRLQSEWTYNGDGKLIKDLRYDAKGKPLPTISDMQRKALQKMVAKARTAKARRRTRRDPTAESSTLANIAELLATDKAPALEWLRASSETSKRNLGEMETDISIEFVQAQHDLGAAAVLAVRITDTYGCDDQTSNDIVIQLPSDPDSRARLFSFARSHATDLGFDPEPDFGQSHLWLWLC